MWHHSTYCTTVRTILSHLHVLYTVRTIRTAHCTYSTCSLFPCFRCWDFIFSICSPLLFTLYHVFTYKCSLSVIHFCKLSIVHTHLVLSAHHHRGSVTILHELHSMPTSSVIWQQLIKLLNRHFHRYHLYQHHCHHHRHHNHEHHRHHHHHTHRHHHHHTHLSDWWVCVRVTATPTCQYKDIPDAERNSWTAWRKIS